MRRVFAMLLMAVLLSTSVFAEVSQKPTQQYSKIFLNPFYRSNLTNNVNVTYTLTVSPPDGISSVVSAIVTFDMWMTPTVTFSAWVNGSVCNNPTYVISTTFSGAGRGVATFDCSNVIKKVGTYNITFRPSGANTGAVSGWIDLTYMNDPPGSLKLSGTEYIAGDTAKTFLQFLDANNQPVNNSECFIQVWYPNDTVVPTLNYSLMSHLNNLSEGIYYKNWVVPNVSGAYPESVKCFRPISFNNVVLSGFATEDWETNTWVGGVGWSQCTGNVSCLVGWDREDAVPLTFIITNGSASGPCYNGTYCAKITGGYGFIERGVVFPDGAHQLNITNWFKFKGFQTNEHFEFWVFDGNWHLIDQIGNAAQYGGYTNQIWYKKSYLLDESLYKISGPVLIGWFTSPDTPAVSDEFYVDDISIDVIAANISISNITDYQVLRGSGEAHVSNLYGQLSAGIAGNSSDQMALLRLINTTTNQTLVVVTSIKNDTSLLAQLYTWIASVFGWVQTDVDQNASTSVVTNNVSVIVQGVSFVSAQYYQQQASAVVAQVLQNGNSVTGATCQLNVYYPNMTLQVVDGVMSYLGVDGLYNYTWTPVTFGSHLGRVNCSGGVLTQGVQASGSLGVSAASAGVIMQSVS